MVNPCSSGNLSSFNTNTEASLQRLQQWKAVRPDSPLLGAGTDELLQLGLVTTVITAIGEGVVLSRAGRLQIGLYAAIPSESVVGEVLYQQDARTALAAAGYRALRPGRGIYRVVTNEVGAACPLIGHYFQGGYTKRNLVGKLNQLEIDLITRHARLVVVHPYPDRVRIRHPQLHLIESEPQWIV